MARKVWQLIPESNPGSPYLLESFPLVIGQAEECDIRLEDAGVSPRHARLSERFHKLTIEDLESVHGTRINDQPVRLAKVCRTQKSETRLQVGETIFLLRYSEPPPESPKPEPSSAKGAPAPREGPEESPASTEAPDLLKPSGFSPRILDPESAPEAPPQHETALPGSPQTGITCPFCWAFFQIEDLLAIAAHPDLIGDPILGEGEPERFLPQHFNPEGQALDSRGMVCRDNACPKCHMRLPEVLLSLLPTFFSIFGAPGSGKSYFLASMCWKLRTILPRYFSSSFQDADTTLNQWLNEYEERLFMHEGETASRQLDKTEIRGSLYREALMNGASVFLPLPSLFTLRPQTATELQPGQKPSERLLVVYDNAGEHFQPGQDTELNPGTRHIAHARGLMFLFDPTKDPRMRSIVVSDDYQMKKEDLIQRQDVILTEMIERLRRHLGLKTGERYRRTFFFAVSKADVLSGFIPLDDSPWAWSETIRANALNLPHVAQVSYWTRALLNERMPELIGMIEAFAEHVVYLPNSALGHSPPLQEAQPLIVSGDIKSQWVETPVLYLLARDGFIPTLSARTTDCPFPDQYDYDGRFISFLQPGTESRLRLPDTFSGFALQDPRTGLVFGVPDVDTPNILGGPLEESR